MEAEAQPRSPYEWDENKRQETIRVRDVDFMLVDQADWSTAFTTGRYDPEKSVTRHTP